MEYLIGDFSKISRLGIKTLRYYHEIGLLEPCRVDAFTGYRYYDEDCLSRVRAISRLKDLGFSLAEIRDTLTGKRKDLSVLRLLREKLADVENQLALMEKRRDRLAAFVNGESLPLLRPGPVAEKSVPDLEIASIRFRGRYAEVGKLLPELLASWGHLASGAPFSLYHDDQPMEEGADIEICLPLSIALPDRSAPGVEEPQISPGGATSRIPPEGVKGQRLPEAVKGRLPPEGVKGRLLRGGRVVSIVHPGTYDQLWVSYQALVDYMNRRGLEQTGPAREIYLAVGGLGRAAGASAGAAGGLAGSAAVDGAEGRAAVDIDEGAAVGASATGHAAAGQSAASSRFLTEIQFPVR